MQAGIKTLEINGEEYVRAADVTGEVGPPTPHRIVVADRGWVFVGPTSELEDGSLVISPAKNIRRWGTEGKGLGHLAQHGPVAGKTVLDAGGVVRVPCHAVVLTMDTEAKLWG